jgi:uncharacterized protein YjbI with pentapeptide repeats
LDLSRANLSGARLSRVNLEGADLSEAKLLFADLSGADLKQASLLKSELACADLSGADLSLANLTLANLRRADLSDANLTQAILSLVLVEGAYVSGARFDNTIVNQCNFARCIGIDQVKHIGPNSITVDTIQSYLGGTDDAFAPEALTFIQHSGVTLGRVGRSLPRDDESKSSFAVRIDDVYVIGPDTNNTVNKSGSTDQECATMSEMSMNEVAELAHHVKRLASE